MNYIQQIPEMAPILEGANHIDVKTVEGDVTLRQFVAAMLAYQPAWVTFLYRVRGVFVRFLGMRQDEVPQAERMRPEDVPMTAGEKVEIFTVRFAEDERFWVVGAVDQHLSAELGVLVEALDSGRRRFHVVTVVHYNNWIGPVYFSIIRPFHHVIVALMARAGVKPVPEADD